MLILLLAGTVVLIHGTPAASQRQARISAVRERADDERSEDPHANVDVLVEAFVVEVKLATLYEMGVSPLGQTPHAVSVRNLLESLKDPRDAIVLTGAKTISLHAGRTGEIRQTESTYRPRTRAIPTNRGQRSNTDYVRYENGQALNAVSRVLSETSLRVDYEFSYSGVRQEQQDDDSVPPATVSWSWEGTVSLATGEPSIVGAAQDRDNAVFLVLTAHIMDRP
jgi:hypothetical protein